MTLGQLLPYLDRLRDFEGGNLVATESAQFFLASALPGEDTDDRVDPFAPMWIRQSNNGDFVHGRMFREDVFDLGREDVVAAGLDPEFRAVAQVHVAAVIQPSHVAGIDPAVADGFAILVGRVPVTGKCDFTAHDKLADIADRNIAAVIIDNADIDERQRLAG